MRVLFLNTNSRLKLRGQNEDDSLISQYPKATIEARNTAQYVSFDTHFEDHHKNII